MANLDYGEFDLGIDVVKERFFAMGLSEGIHSSHVDEDPALAISSKQILDDL